MKFSEDLEHLINIDNRFKDLFERFGTPDWKMSNNLLRSFCKSIIYQQLSGKAANTIYRRFLGLYGDIFPSREKILLTEIEKMRTAGLSVNKAQYIKNLAMFFLNEPMTYKSYKRFSNQEIYEKFLKIKGVGQWTVDMILISSLGKKDVLPTGDLGIKKGIQIFFKTKSLPNRKKMCNLTKKWQPFRSLASWYMWQLVDNSQQ